MESINSLEHKYNPWKASKDKLRPWPGQKSRILLLAPLKIAHSARRARHMPAAGKFLATRNLSTLVFFELPLPA